MLRSQGTQEHKNLEEDQVLVGEDKGSEDISDPPGGGVLGATYSRGLAPTVPRNLYPEE